MTLTKSRILILLLVAGGLATAAERPDAESLDPLVRQLGADEFGQRLAAQNRLIELAKPNPAEASRLLRARLEGEANPEIRHRLRAVLRAIALANPAERIAFTEAKFKEGIWKLYDDGPKEARFAFKDGVLEYDSTEEASEGVMFMHRMAKPAAGGEFRFGPPPEPEAQRLVLDAEIKVLKEQHIREGLAAVHLNVEDHLTSWALMIQEDGIFTYRNNVVHRMDTTDRWHHYRFVVEGDSQQVFVDDMVTPVFNLKRTKQAGRYWASFGDGTSGAGAVAQIRKVTLSRYDLDGDESP